MIKIAHKGNGLIKRSGLRRTLKSAGIISVSEDAFVTLEEFGQDIYEKIARALKERWVIGAKKVVKKVDVEAVLKELK